MMNEKRDPEIVINVELEYQVVKPDGVQFWGFVKMAPSGGYLVFRMNQGPTKLEGYFEVVG